MTWDKICPAVLYFSRISASIKLSSILNTSDHQLSLQTGQVSAAVFFYHHQILQPDATQIRIIEARLNRDHLTALERCSRFAQRRPLMYFQAHPVPGGVGEAASFSLRISLLLEYIGYPPVYLRSRGSLSHRL
jgi:hypothetical protein